MPLFWKGASAKKVKTEDLSPGDIIIAVMGPTGSGKSTFINTITGLGIGVGHNLESCTSKVDIVRLSLPGLPYGDLVFVDTPGFDDTNKSDADILKMVADWLKSTYEKGISLSGLVYFHRISDNRLRTGTPLENLRMFEELCGKNTFQNVILATTMWDQVDKEMGEARERELETVYWRAMLERNSRTSRLMRTRESAFELIDPLIEAANERSSVQLQREMLDMRNKLPSTSAERKLFWEMELLVRKREDLLCRIRNEMKRANGDEMISEALEEEHQKLQLSLESTVNELRSLKLPFGQRFWDKLFGTKSMFVSMIFNRLNKDRNGDRQLSGSSKRRQHQANKDHSGEAESDKNSQQQADQDHSGDKPSQMKGIAIFKSAFWKKASAKQVKMDDLSPGDIIIAVMGPTGSGKSTFINTITGLETGVGHNLESCTSKVGIVRLSLPGLPYGDLVFVDTPGFNHTNKSDADILKMVADWLKSTYDKDIFLSGLVYFHRISDNRLTGTPLKNLRMFEELCGKNAFQNVILATTMWDEIDQETGEAREHELKTKYWRAMLEQNSRTNRFMRTRESAFELIDPLIDARNEQISVQLQQEMVDMRKKLPATSAGQKLFSEMELLVRKREDLLRRIRNEMKRTNGDEMISEALEEEHQKIQLNLESTVNEMRSLKLSFGQRFWDKLFGKKSKFVSMIFNRLSKDRNSDRQLPGSSKGHSGEPESDEKPRQQANKNHSVEPESDEKSDEKSQQQADQNHSIEPEIDKNSQLKADQPEDHSVEPKIDKNSQPKADQPENHSVEPGSDKNSQPKAEQHRSIEPERKKNSQPKADQNHSVEAESDKHSQPKADQPEDHSVDSYESDEKSQRQANKNNSVEPAKSEEKSQQQADQHEALSGDVRKLYLKATRRASSRVASLLGQPIKPVVEAPSLVHQKELPALMLSLGESS